MKRPDAKISFLRRWSHRPWLPSSERKGNNGKAINRSTFDGENARDSANSGSCLPRIFAGRWKRSTSTVSDVDAPPLPDPIEDHPSTEHTYLSSSGPEHQDMAILKGTDSETSEKDISAADCGTTARRSDIGTTNYDSCLQSSRVRSLQTGMSSADINRVSPGKENPDSKETPRSNISVLPGKACESTDANTTKPKAMFEDVEDNICGNEVRGKGLAEGDRGEPSVALYSHDLRTEMEEEDSGNHGKELRKADFSYECNDGQGTHSNDRREIKLSEEDEDRLRGTFEGDDLGPRLKIAGSNAMSYLVSELSREQVTKDIELMEGDLTTQIVPSVQTSGRSPSILMTVTSTMGQYFDPSPKFFPFDTASEEVTESPRRTMADHPQKVDSHTHPTSFLTSIISGCHVLRSTVVAANEFIVPFAGQAGYYMDEDPTNYLAACAAAEEHDCTSIYGSHFHVHDGRCSSPSYEISQSFIRRRLGQRARRDATESYHLQHSPKEGEWSGVSPCHLDFAFRQRPKLNLQFQPHEDPTGYLELVADEVID